MKVIRCLKNGLKQRPTAQYLPFLDACPALNLRSSRYNTQTKRLTAAMFKSVIEDIANYLEC